jgi:hypothetical protein
LYYVIRAKQYNQETTIKKTQIVNFRILIQTFVAIFLNSPHESHLHEAKLLEMYGGETNSRKIFVENHDPHVYYICALVWYIFEKSFREGLINNKHKTYKYHLYFIFCNLFGQIPANLNSSKNVKHYYNDISSNMKHDKIAINMKKVVGIFEIAQRKWQEKGKSYYGIKDNKDFAALLKEIIYNDEIKKKLGKFDVDEKEEIAIFSGRIVSIIKKNDIWFGFIDRGQFEDNIYFDNRGYNGSINSLSVNGLVNYEIGRNAKGEMAINISIKKQTTTSKGGGFNGGGPL